MRGVLPELEVAEAAVVEEEDIKMVAQALTLLAAQVVEDMVYLARRWRVQRVVLPQALVAQEAHQQQQEALALQEHKLVEDLGVLLALLEAPAQQVQLGFI